MQFKFSDPRQNLGPNSPFDQTEQTKILHSLHNMRFGPGRLASDWSRSRRQDSLQVGERQQFPHAA